MAKKKQTKEDKQVSETGQAEDTKVDSTAAVDERLKADLDENLSHQESTLAVIKPVAFDITLKALHPQSSYGRCGYRFNKESAVQISVDALTGEQIACLFDDPYLDVVPVVEE